MTITSIAIDREYVYTLDNGNIFRNLIFRGGIQDPIIGPVHGTPIIQLMTTNRWLYALCGDGAVFRIYGDDDHAPWEVYDVPAGTTWIASNDIDVVTISADRLYRRPQLRNSAFQIMPADARLAGISQIDYDELYGYALVAGTIYFRQFPRGGWHPYPQQLPNTAIITAGIEYLYAVNAAGTVYRSKIPGHSGWDELAGLTGVTVISIPSDHLDQLFFSDGAVSGSVLATNWSSTPPVPPPEGWIVSDWIIADWILTA